MTDTKVPVDKVRVNEFMAAFRYGARTEDLGRVDDRRHSGRYDYVTWMIALDGATLFEHGREYRVNLIDALSRGLSELEAAEYAYATTADAHGMN